MHSPEQEFTKEQVDKAPKGPLGQNFYERLGVSPEASQEDIGRSFRRLSKEYHPDKGGDEGDSDEFKYLSEAYATLKNPDLREKYDNRSVVERLPSQELKRDGQKKPVDLEQEKERGGEGETSDSQMAEKNRLEELYKELEVARQNKGLSPKERMPSRKEREAKAGSPEQDPNNMEKVRKVLGNLYSSLPHEGLIGPGKVRRIIEQSELDEFLSQKSSKRRKLEGKLSRRIAFFRWYILARSEFIDLCIKLLRKEGALEQRGHHVEVISGMARRENIPAEKLPGGEAVNSKNIAPLPNEKRVENKSHT